MIYLDNHPENQITLVLNPNTEKSKKIIAIAKSLKNTPVLIERTSDELTALQLLSLCKKMNIHPQELIHKDCVKNSAFKLDEQSAAEFIQNNPKALQYPIAVKGSNVVLITTPTDIFKLTRNNAKEIHLEH